MATRDPFMAGRDPFTDPLVASRDPLCLSPEDDLRPPARERTCSRRLGANPGPLRLSPHRGEQEGSCGAGSLRFPHRLTDPRSERERRPPILQATLQESKNTGQTKQTRTDDPRATPGAKPVPERVPEQGPVGAAVSVPSGPVTKETPLAQAGEPVRRNESPGRLERPTVGRYGERYFFPIHIVWRYVPDPVTKVNKYTMLRRELLPAGTRFAHVWILCAQPAHPTDRMTDEG